LSLATDLVTSLTSAILGSVFFGSDLLTLLGELVGVFNSTFFEPPPGFVVVMITRGVFPVGAGAVAVDFLVGTGVTVGTALVAGFSSDFEGASSLPPPKSFLKKPGLSSARADPKDKETNAKICVAMTALENLESNPEVMAGVTAKVRAKKAFYSLGRL
jgi:hypothetical protein